MIICIDFDGTCVTHEFPDVGEDIGAIPVLKKLVENNHKLILFTMRSDNRIKKDSHSYDSISYHPLSDAVNWFKENDIPLYGINTNPEQKSWTESPKAYGQLYIDDAALGCPLKYNEGRPFVDWEAVEEILKTKKLI